MTLKSIVSLLLVSLLASSCRFFQRNHSSNFSKRKYLSGHFWNLKENFRSKTTDLLVENEIVESDNHVEKSTLELEYSPANTIASNDKEMELQGLNEKLDINNIEETNEVVDIEKTTDTIPLPAQIEEKEQYPVKPKDHYGPWLVFGSIALSFWLGIIGLIAYFVLFLLDISVRWLLVTSLWMVGIPILLVLIVLIVVMIVMAQKPRHIDPAYGQDEQ